MAIAYDNSASTFFTTGATSITTGSWTIAGSDRLLIAAVETGDGTSVAASGVKWGGSGGTALTQVDAVTSHNTYFHLSMWRLTAPAAASQTLYASFPGTVAEAALGGVSLTGVDQTTPVRTHATASSSGITGNYTATVDATTVANDWVVDAVSGNNQAAENPTLTAGANQTPRVDIDGASLGGYHSFGMSTETATGATTTMSWAVTSTSAAGGYVIFALPVIPSTGGGGGGGGGMSTYLKHLGQRTYRPRPYAPGRGR